MSGTWYYNTDGTRQGPVDTQTIQGMAAAGQVQPQHMVWRPGMADWAQAGMMQELFVQPVPGMAVLPPAGAGAGALVAAPVGLTTCGDEYSQGLIWRDGKKLVMLAGAKLPLRCAKTNEPVEELVERKMTWCPLQWLLLLGVTVLVYVTAMAARVALHPVMCVFLLLVSFFVCAIIILCVRKEATIMIGLSKRTIRRRRIAIDAIAVGWLGFLAALVLVFAGAVAPGWIALSGLLVFLVTVIYVCVQSRTVSASKIDDHCVHLKGCCGAYLDAFPPAAGVVNGPGRCSTGS